MQFWTDEGDERLASIAQANLRIMWNEDMRQTSMSNHDPDGKCGVWV